MSFEPENNRPSLVTEYCNRSLGADKPDFRRVRLRQQGEIRLGPQKPWMPFTAEQTISVHEIEFRWRARFKMARLIPGIVVDCFENGRGQLDAWILGFLRVAHARGPKVDQSEAQRYLAEIAWCPMALIKNDSLRFQEISESIVRVSSRDDNTYVDLMFGRDGDVTGAKTITRYRDQETQPWEGRFSDYKMFGSVRLPSFGEVWWDAPEGRFVYWRAHITDFELI